MDPLRDLDGRDHDPAELPSSLLWDRADAEKAKAAGIATPRQLQLLQRPDLKAHVRRLNQNVAPVVRRAKRDLLNRPELIERRHRREVVRDFGRPPCEARPHYGRRQSRGAPCAAVVPAAQRDHAGRPAATPTNLQTKPMLM